MQLSRFLVLCTFSDGLPPEVEREIKNIKGVWGIDGCIVKVTSMESALDVKRLVESMDGRVKVYEVVGEGGEYRFECQRCGRCCSEAYILILPEEAWRISGYLNLSLEGFLEEYCEVVNRGFLTFKLKNKPGCECIFFESDTCKIHPVKPGECRIYPIIPVEGAIWWVHCPGSGKGRRYELREMEKLAGERYNMVKNYCTTYSKLIYKGYDQNSIIDLLFKKASSRQN